MATKRKGAVLGKVSASKRVRQEEEDHSTPASIAPSFAFTEEASIAETSATSTSKRPKKYLCEEPGCGKAFDRPARLEIHSRSHTNERPFVCDEDECGKTFTRAEHLTRHKKDKHSDDRNHVCTFSAGGGECGKSFTTATRLRRHVAAHESKDETTCSHPGCGKVFRKQETLQRHIKTDHLHEKPFVCTHVEFDVEGQQVQCGQAFAKADGLKNHEAREHSGARYFCEMCSSPDHNHDFANTDEMTFDMDALMLEYAQDNPEPTFEELNENIFADLDAPIITTNTTDTRVGFPTYADLQLHIRTIHPPTCMDCGKQCTSNRALKAHREIEHSDLSDRQTHLCTWPNCGRGFTKAGNLKVHVQGVHMKARPFICGEDGCGKSFGTKANLDEHLKTQHLGLPGKAKPSRVRRREVKDEVEREFGAINALTGHDFVPGYEGYGGPEGYEEYSGMVLDPRLEVFDPLVETSS
ncbi:hypothetical protein LTR17_018178 [Elasticomyces elasticus]|nr:hypothetical protein LTR17_018178 [Elasticomyces elasticus]